MRIIFILTLFFISHGYLSSQTINKELIKVNGVILENGDTIPLVILPYVYIYGDRVFKSRREERMWTKLHRDVFIVYPYAKLVTKMFKDCEIKMKGLSKKEQKRMVKQMEKELIHEFEDDIKHMSLNQGRILIKLIDRNTGSSSYEIIDELRGTFQAFFWQSIARLFRTNLKEKYDPYNNKEDFMIEQIILSIEDGTYVRKN